MDVLFVLLPLALTFAATAVGVFLWAARSGQFDDLITPAVRVLHDDEPAAGPRHPPGAGPAGR
jgi:cbb3-type cytochrome oxidase maturation protein